jgi:Kdo2-lipid IVA lauroyltransferase/acyltransferase
VAGRALRHRIKHARRLLVYYALRVCYGLLGFMPRSFLQALVGAVAGCMYFFDPRFRPIMQHNLAIALPERSATSRERIARRSYWNIGRSIVDVLVAYRRRDRRIVEALPFHRGDIESSCDAFTRAGAVAVSGHVGCWELLACALSQHAPGRLAVMAKRLYFPPFNDWLVGVREAFGIRVFYQDELPLRVVRYLRARNVLGILPDQDVKDVAGIFAPFFGVPAWTPTGPAALAVTARVPMYVVYLVWDGDCYRVLREGPLPLPNTGSRSEDIRILTEGWTRILERVIREYPDQWVWFHRRWRTKPSASGDLSARPPARRKIPASVPPDR